MEIKAYKQLRDRINSCANDGELDNVKRDIARYKKDEDKESLLSEVEIKRNLLNKIHGNATFKPVLTSRPY